MDTFTNLALADTDLHSKIEGRGKDREKCGYLCLNFHHARALGVFFGFGVIVELCVGV